MPDTRFASFMEDYELTYNSTSCNFNNKKCNDYFCDESFLRYRNCATANVVKKCSKCETDGTSNCASNGTLNTLSSNLYIFINYS